MWSVKGYVAETSCLYLILHILINFTKQADKIEKLEKEFGWREEEFDFILQFMRTILLKRT